MATADLAEDAGCGVGDSPQGVDDERDILAGLSVMSLAIADRQNLAVQELPPRPRGEQRPDSPDLYCVAAVGHDGGHLYAELGIWMAWLCHPRRRRTEDGSFERVS